MLPKQLQIHISNGIINKISRSEGYSELIIDGKSERFENAYILPGLIDSHCHIWGLGMILHDPSFIGTKNVEECIEIIKKHVPNKGEWYYGRGWNHELWDNAEYPTKEALDSILHNNPAYFIRIDGHSVWVNSKALEIAGIDATTPNPTGGEILHNSAGEPSGVLVDNAMDLVAIHIPDYSDERLEIMLTDAMNECAKAGLTELHDMDVPVDYIDKFIELDNAGKIKQRIRAYAAAQNDQYLNKGLEPYKGRNFHLAGIKFFVDGALGSRGAALAEPYNDDKSTKGLYLIEENELYNKICKGIELGFEIATHAIGDAANNTILNVYEKIRRKYGYEPILRIEHAQTLLPDDIERIAKLDIKIAMQAIHCTSDAEMALKRLGVDRCRERAYLWNSLLKQNIKIMGGSDSPIEPFNPFTGIEAFVERKSLKSGEEFFPEEKITLKEAIHAYSTSVRENFGNDYIIGLHEGQIADLIIIDNNLEKNIASTKVLATVANGELIYKK